MRPSGKSCSNIVCVGGGEAAYEHEGSDQSHGIKTEEHGSLQTTGREAPNGPAVLRQSELSSLHIWETICCCCSSRLAWGTLAVACPGKLRQFSVLEGQPPVSTLWYLPFLHPKDKTEFLENYVSHGRLCFLVLYSVFSVFET